MMTLDLITPVRVERSRDTCLCCTSLDFARDERTDSLLQTPKTAEADITGMATDGPTATPIHPP
jgi:hypothetical protein